MKRSELKTGLTKDKLLIIYCAVIAAILGTISSCSNEEVENGKSFYLDYKAIDSVILKKIEHPNVHTTIIHDTAITDTIFIKNLALKVNDNKQVRVKMGGNFIALVYDSGKVQEQIVFMNEYFSTENNYKMEFDIEPWLDKFLKQ